jgi:DNA-directed RNA polymerase subunit RPC12/RpoP
MPAEPTDRSTTACQLDSDNTFSFLPGPMAGVACPACFRDILLKEVIESGECNSCGAELELTLTATSA